MFEKILEHKNAVHDQVNNLIDLEIRTARYGWIPTTILIDAVEPHQQDVFDSLNISELPVKEYTTTLDEVLSEKVGFIKKLRSAALLGRATTVTTDDGRRWQTDKPAMDALKEAMLSGVVFGELPPGTEWRDVENVRHPASMELLKEIGLKASIRPGVIWKSSWDHIDALRACGSIDELNAYEMPAIL